ncbi:MAG: hypothetical protein AW08_03450 [Candidatus Accumulibacter adjunctus]|uniref:Uncharacterized protein n=1 Tax=Candidatus Accumulibacter adjunctus TaxID=1454001 RepID=A0A011M670_9PROT|nr:MAG: hypothetical protein AW08_03450 [Candidatus Accumulibacter adjunctus]
MLWPQLAQDFLAKNLRQRHAVALGDRPQQELPFGSGLTGRGGAGKVPFPAAWHAEPRANAAGARSRAPASGGQPVAELLWRPFETPLAFQQAPHRQLAQTALPTQGRDVPTDRPIRGHLALGDGDGTEKREQRPSTTEQQALVARRQSVPVALTRHSAVAQHHHPVGIESRRQQERDIALLLIERIACPDPLEFEHARRRAEDGAGGRRIDPQQGHEMARRLQADAEIFRCQPVVLIDPWAKTA